MKSIISRAMSSGLDFTRIGALKTFLNRIDVDDELYDKVYVNIKNRAFEDEFARTSYKRRAIFLPQCLRDSENCEAELTDRGYECAGCGSCIIEDIISRADELGYQRVYIVPGGSMVRKIMKKDEPKAVLGVACHYELAEAMEYATLKDISPQGVPLLTGGCKDTQVDKDQLFEAMRKKI